MNGILSWGGGGGEGSAITTEKFLHSKSREKNHAQLEKGRKNQASLSTRRIKLDQMKN